MQQAVSAWGCQRLELELFSTFGIDGVFGSETKRAVETFQSKNDAQVDGVVGTEALGKLDAFVGSPATGKLPCIDRANIDHTIDPPPPIKGFAPVEVPLRK